jgi:integrase
MAGTKRINKGVVDALKPAAARFVSWDTEIPGFGVRVYPTGQKVYVLKYRVGGGRAARIRWANIGKHGIVTPDQARDIARRWAAQVAEGGDPAQVREEQRKAPTLSQALDKYLAEHVTIRNKPSTQAQVSDLVERIIRPALGKLKVAEVSRTDVSRLHSGLSDRQVTGNRALAILSKVFSLAEVWGYRPDNSNPCKRVEKFKETPRERFLSDEEFYELGEALARAEREPLTVAGPDGELVVVRANPQAVRAIRLMIFTGMRTGEVRAMRWEHTDLEKGVVRLPDSKTGKKVVQLPPAAIRVILTADRPESGTGYVIRGGRKNDPETPLVNVKGTWGAVRKVANLEDVRPHDLRHSFASVAAAGGASLPIIGALLGHSEAKTTQRYAHLANDPLRQAAESVAAAIADSMLPRKFEGSPS